MAKHPNRAEDVSDLERCLARCRPTAAGLDTDAMLFAAGAACARRGRNRWLWPGATACLAALSAVLGTWLAVERSERLELARQLEELPVCQEPAPAPTPAAAPSVEMKPSNQPQPQPNSLPPGLQPQIFKSSKLGVKGSGFREP